MRVRLQIQGQEADWLADQLASSELCSGMQTAEVQELLARHPGRVDRYQKLDMVATEGDPVGGLSIILRGQLQATMGGASGKQLLMDTLSQGRILAPALIFAEKNALPVTLRCRSETDIYSLPKEEFLEVMHEFPGVQMRFIRKISNISSFLMGKIQQLSLRSLPSRLAEFLIRHAHRRPDGIAEFTRRSTWQDISDMLGVSRQSLARVMAQFHQEGIIEVENVHVRIVNPHRLATIREEG